MTPPGLPNAAEVHGRRLLPNIIDQFAREDPDRAWASVQSNGCSEFEDISFETFANAINRVAHWIEDNVGVPSPCLANPVLAYIGPSDLRYYVLLIATVKAGYVPLFISHVNSLAANTSLFNAVECTKLLCGFQTLDNVQIDEKLIKVFYLPSYENTWDTTPMPKFPFMKDFEDAVNEQILIIHTSGSTGLPKPIKYTHGWFAGLDSRQDIPDFEGHISEPRSHSSISRHFVGFPPFHAAGLASGLQDSVFFGITIVFPRADRPVDARSVIDVIDHGRIDGGALLPHVLEELARNPEALQRLQKLRYIDWVGGPISQETGDLISAQTRLRNCYASTELGASNTLVKYDKSLWNYYFFNPQANGFEFRPVPGESNLYELFVIKDSKLEQPIFRIFPHLNEWPMKDLFSAHPTLKHHWRLEGRSDDLIVLQNGCKLNPRTIEDTIRHAPSIKNCMVFGANRARPGILLEPIDSDILEGSNTLAQSDLLQEALKFVERSNQTVQETGVIIRELVALTQKGKPLPRTGKRTLQRKAALDLYKDEIDGLHETLPLDLQRVKDFRIGSSQDWK